MRVGSFRANSTLKINSNIKQIGELNDRLQLGTTNPLPFHSINNNNVNAGFKSDFCDHFEYGSYNFNSFFPRKSTTHNSDCLNNDF